MIAYCTPVSSWLPNLSGQSISNLRNLILLAWGFLLLEKPIHLRLYGVILLLASLSGIIHFAASVVVKVLVHRQL
jgi:hypothetical protein